MSPEHKSVVLLSHNSELLLSNISQGTRLCNYQPVAEQSQLHLDFFFNTFLFFPVGCNALGNWQNICASMTSTLNFTLL